MIPEIYRDNTTIVKNHPMRNHVGCVIIRIGLGILVLNNTIPTKILAILCLFIVATFGNKFYKLQNVWKVYIRTVLVYATIGLLILLYDNKYTSLYGTLIIVDALMGLQSRHIFERLSLINK
jgi:hypothetical protein